MNAELQLKLQAWVDGELPEREARQIADLVRTDATANALAAELKMTRSFLAGNEPEAALSESREFYWSKIEREIERQDKAEEPVSAVPWLAGLRRFLAPLSGLALVAFLSILSFKVFQLPADDPARQLVETENLSEHVGSISYRSQSDNMFVVYLYAKDTEVSEDIDPDAGLEDDLFIQ
jgi:anti-sigma factor RsiW